jgi:hypothetical protein
MMMMMMRKKERHVCWMFVASHQSVIFKSRVLKKSKNIRQAPGDTNLFTKSRNQQRPPTPSLAAHSLLFGLPC